MRVLFSNPPWYTWEGPGHVALRGVRAGSRWPHQFQYQSNGVIDAFSADFTFADFTRG